MPLRMERMLLTTPLLAAVLAAAAAMPDAKAASGTGSESGPPAPRLVSAAWQESLAKASLELEGLEFAPVDAPEPDGAAPRIGARRRNYKTRYRMQERTFGVGIQPTYVSLAGDVVKTSFRSGVGFSFRLMAQISPANQLWFDFGYSFHDMKNPRPMFFRTAVTPDSKFEGKLHVYSPAFLYAFTIPLTSGFTGRAVFLPKLYSGMGPLYTEAEGKVTNAGSKDTVTGKGTQPFFQFVLGTGLDVRVVEFGFVGFELRYRASLPTRRPDQTAEFTIPKIYVFESALSFGYFFY